MFFKKIINLIVGIADMRDLAYDNRTNIEENNKGIQVYMLEINDYILYIELIHGIL